MKTIKNTVMLLCAGIGFVGCNKVEVTMPTFDVQVETLTYKVGDMVDFTFTGDADQITFYSGETMKDYAYIDGRVDKVLALNTSFSTAIRYGLANGQKDLLSVWVSSDFSGDYTIEGVHSATWKDNVSKDFTLAPPTMDNNTAANFIPSGVLDIMSEAEEGKPLYLAFRYKKDAGKEQRNWFMRNIAVNAVTDLGSFSLFDASGFTLVYDDNYEADADKNSSVTSTQITLRSPNNFNPLAVEVWAISPPISTAETDLGPDKGTSIKGFRDLKLEEYSYTYEEAGEYTVTFVASNSNLYGESKVVKQLKITVTE